jgi:hypothetical protein
VTEKWGWGRGREEVVGRGEGKERGRASNFTIPHQKITGTAIGLERSIKTL